MPSDPVSRHYPADEYGNPPETLIITPSGEQYYVECTTAQEDQA